ncbi:hypothetical protein OAG71_02535 [bacterium]|nr:hypothetical protein [bacterium]
MKAGVINPTCMYNREALKEIGIGDRLLSEARKSGIVKPFTPNVGGARGRMIFYSGDEVIQWIKTFQGKSA